VNRTSQLPCVLFVPVTAGFLTDCRRFQLQRASKLVTRHWTICRRAVSSIIACFVVLEILTVALMYSYFVFRREASVMLLPTK